MTSPDLTTHNLKTFVGTKDFDLSRDFYLALGWKMNFDEGELAELELDGRCFYLQRYYQKQWCNNSMMYMDVAFATAWHQHIERVLLEHSYGGARTQSPKPADYAKLVTHFWDPAGVLWHLAQLR